MQDLAFLFRSGLGILRNRGPRQALRSGFYFGYEASLRRYHRATGRFEDGDPIYEDDWDVLLVLDGCRLDLAREVGQSYDFVDAVEERRSLATSSVQWMQRNFAEEYADQTAETAYVTGNPYSGDIVDSGDFAHLDEVWRYAWDDEVGTIRPRPLTDRAITTWRERDPDRMIVHYMQPHAPFLADDLQYASSIDTWGEAYRGEKKNVWNQLRDGELDRDRLWTAYRDNLEAALDDVTLLLENVDADRVAITSDHGNAFGEGGIYGHPADIDCAPLRRVPWIETTATDEGTHDPDTDRRRGPADDVEDKLADLGYL